MEALKYDWELGQEELFIKVDAYASMNNLYIGLYQLENGYPELFGDLTINLPAGTTEVNEAYIDDFGAKDKLKFIEKYQLGEVLPDKGSSGVCKYAKVAFNMERLAEFDKRGVEAYKQLHGITEKKEKDRSTKKKDMER